ncbi:MAG: hypothetical protein QG599_1605 [Pseudomonadota bacterium]|nr:hypothetical protein [Pseudomonadota bacterium]
MQRRTFLKALGTGLALGNPVERLYAGEAVAGGVPDLVAVKGVSTADIVNLQSQLLSTDLVTADTAAAKLFGLEPSEVGYIRLAGEMGVGRGDLESLATQRIVL